MNKSILLGLYILVKNIAKLFIYKSVNNVEEVTMKTASSPICNFIVILDLITSTYIYKKVLCKIIIDYLNEFYTDPSITHKITVLIFEINNVGLVNLISSHNEFDYNNQITVDQLFDLLELNESAFNSKSKNILIKIIRY
jgi:hypothetical protein